MDFKTYLNKCFFLRTAPVNFANANRPPSLDFIIRIEGLESLDIDNIEIPYKIDSNFDLRLFFMYQIKKKWVIFGNNSYQVSSLINDMEENPELRIHEDVNDENQIERPLNCEEKITCIENEPFIADPDNLTVSWESDRYVMRNQKIKVIELLKDQKYRMIIKKRSNTEFISKSIYIFLF